MSNSKSFAAPRPEVLHLPTLLRRVESGEIRVPDFQRKFVWEEKQIVELLESVFKGYPIGSLLFWRAESSQLRYDARRSYPLPAVEKAREPISFLLDGQQRLSTLYGCLYLPKDRQGGSDVFNVLFNLKTHQFSHLDADAPPDSESIPLWSLFSPTAFLEVQRSLQSERDGARLLEESVKLHTVFHEYMVPTVTIEKRRVTDVVEIFERVNRTGTKLSAVDFMRAVTWSAGFDLGQEVARLEKATRAKGFKIRPETLVKVIAVAVDTAPLPEPMLEMRELAVARLNDGVKKARQSLLRSIEFLRSELHIFSGEYVPYEGQLLLLTKLFIDAKVDAVSDDVKGDVRRWFLATSLSESLRGKPDHVVAAIVAEAGKLAAEEPHRLQWALRASENDFIKRRLIKGKALASGLVTMFALSTPRSIVSGERFAPEEFTGEFNADRFVPILSLEQLQEVNGELESARVLANILVASAADVGKLTVSTAGAAVLKMANSKGGRSGDVFESQILSDRAVEYLQKSDHEAFLKQRAKDIMRRAKKLLGG